MLSLTVSMAVLSVGPLIAFGFLLIPALTSHLFARTMRQFTLAASLLGGASSFVGFWFAYAYDLPVGPTDVVLLGVIYSLGFVAKKVWWTLGKARSVQTKRTREETRWSHLTPSNSAPVRLSPSRWLAAP